LPFSLADSGVLKEGYMKASAGAGDLQISQFDPSRPSVGWSPRGEVVDDDPS